MWNHRNDIVFKNCKSDPIAILEQARYMFHYTMLYKKNANMDPLRYSTGDHHYKPRMNCYKVSWKPPPMIGSSGI